MKFYREQASGSWYATLTEAHHAERTGVEPVYRPNVRIHEVEVPTDKAGVLALLRGDHALARDTGRIWTLTSRGGLRSATE